MSYNAISAMAHDGELRNRVVACAAQEGVTYPSMWADQYIWNVVSPTDWTQAYKYALDSGNQKPGYDEAVITDGMILASVQAQITRIANNS